MQRTWMSAPVEKSENPDLIRANGVVDTIELEAMNRRAPHLRKTDAIQQR